MRWIDKLTLRLRSLLRRTRVEDELSSELRFHLDQQVEENLAVGMSADQARASALRSLGSVALTKDQCRESLSLRLLDEVRQDVRYAFRMLGRNPGFTIVAVLTLMLGIGANTAIFSVVDHIVFRPLGYQQPDRLFVIHERLPDDSQAPPLLPVKVLHFQEWQRAVRAFDQLALVASLRVNLTGSGEPQRVSAARATSNLFSLLGVQPQLGRGFLDEEDQPGRDHVVVISDDLWRRRFNSDPGVVGRLIRLDDESYEIVGVLPPRFTFPRLNQLYAVTIAPVEVPQIWKPFAATNAERDPAAGFNYPCIVRLKPSITASQALSDLNGVQATLSTLDPSRAGLAAALVPLQDQITGKARLSLLLTLTAAGAVLLIGCVNIANLLLARTLRRRHEIAIRGAIGAGRGRLIRQLLVESLVICGLGGGSGVIAAYLMVPLIVANAPGDLPRLGEIHLDVRILFFSLCTSIIVGLFVGLLPAWSFAQMPPSEALKPGARSTTANPASHRLRSILVTAQIAITAVCLIVGGLLLRSVTKLLQVDRGFETERILTVDTNLPAQRYRTPQSRAAFIQTVVERAQSVPGVVAVGVSNKLPLTGVGGNGLLSAVGATTSAAPSRLIVDVRLANPAYFRTMGIALRDGRIFTDTDRGQNVAVVSALTAQRVWPGENPLGKQFRLGPPSNPVNEVIGIVGDVRGISLDSAQSFTAYIPYWQFAPPGPPAAIDLSLVVRTAVEPLGLSSSIRDLVHTIDAELPLSAFQTMDAVVERSLEQRRFQVALVLLFGAAAIFLAAVGIYGVVSYSVSQRTSEIGTRLALGAHPSHISRLVFIQGLIPVSIGLIAGVIASMGLARVLRSLLFNVTPIDPITLAVVISTILGAAMVALYIPARRATRVEPLSVLRCE